MRDIPADSNPAVIGSFTIVQVDPKLDRETGAQASTKDGRLKWDHLTLHQPIAHNEFGRKPGLETVVVALADAPQVQVGQQVRFLGLRALHWEMEVKPGVFKSGISLSADGVEPVSTSSKREA